MKRTILISLVLVCLCAPLPLLLPKLRTIIGLARKVSQLEVTVTLDEHDRPMLISQYYHALDGTKILHGQEIEFDWLSRTKVTSTYVDGTLTGFDANSIGPAGDAPKYK